MNAHASVFPTPTILAQAVDVPPPAAPPAAAAPEAGAPPAPVPAPGVVPPPPVDGVSPEAVTVQPGAPVPAVPPGQKVDPPWWTNSFIPLFVAIILLYLFMFRSQKKKERKRTDMLSTLKRGDRVQTIGGILGTVIEAREHDVLLKVDENSNTKIRFSRNAIHRVIEDDGKVEAK